MASLPGSSIVNCVVPLEWLAPGEEGHIQSVEGNHDLVVRLAEMGFRLGVRVRMLQPGSPCIVAVNNHRISFRGEQSASVMVEVLSQAAAQTLFPEG